MIFTSTAVYDIYPISDKTMHLFVKTLAGKMVTMEIHESDTVKKIMDRISDKEGIPPDKLVLCAEQQPEDDYSIQSTPDMFGSEEIADRKSDPQWTPGSSCPSQQKCTIDSDCLFFVTFGAIRQLFYQCREPGCDAQVSESDISIGIKGAGLKISALCNKNHFTRWQSAEFFNDVSYCMIIEKFQNYTKAFVFVLLV
jgi:hypothetical protein